YKVPVEMGRMRVSYRESIQQSASVTHVHDTLHLGQKGVFAGLQTSVAPRAEGSGNHVQLKQRADEQPVSKDLAEAIRAGAEDALARGLLLGYPMVDVAVTISALNIKPE